ncbi:conserved hypothetical protein [Sporisorium reilianum SRZ2]|uniref:Uncharacterized protein n=1 Tax=Sporisorium reilianum (strain SRZ2) TaxID=999809 RepID=E7A399_SPORE|nr:conserved hypothetical protein [Sporisorium reilianum SRZ2]
MPPSRKHRPEAQWDESASQSSFQRPRGQHAGNVSLSSTVGAPTPARRRDMTDYSIASTPAAAAHTKRGRPSKYALTTPSAMALTSANTSIASTSYGAAAAPRPRGRPPKSILSTPGSRTIASPPNSVSFSDQSKRRGRPPKNASAAAGDASTSTALAKRRGRPPGSANKAKQPSKHTLPDAELDSDSDVSLLDGASATSSAASGSDTDASASASDDEVSETSARPRTASRKKRKGWPSERERVRKWRRLTIEERECVTSEGGLVWRTAIPLLNSMPKNIRSMVADSLTRALNRIDAKLESALVPPLARLPQGSTTTRKDLASSMLAWRLEEEASLLRSEAPLPTPQPLGLNADISDLEHMLLPEAEHIVQLSKTLANQSEHLDQASAHIARLKRDRRLVKSAGSSDYPANLDAHPLLSATHHTPALDPPLSSFLRLSHSV